MERNIQPPGAKKVPKELTIHGHTRVDNYFWLRERENPEVINYLKAENEYLDAKLAHTKGLQEKLYNEIVGRIKQNDQSAPYKDNGYYYYKRFEEGKEYPVYCRREGTMDADEIVLLNVNEMAKGYSYFKVSGVHVSPDNRFLAYGVDTVSRRKYTIFVKDLQTGELLVNNFKNTTGGITWANDSKTIFFTRKDGETLRACEIFRCDIFNGAEEKVYFENDETFSTGIFKTKSDKYLMIVSYASLSTEFRYLDADNPYGEFTVFHPRERELEYSVDHYKDSFYIVTNLEARNFRLMRCPLDHTTREFWQEVIPHREETLLSDIEIFKDFYVINERKEGLNHLRIIRWEDKQEHYVPFEEEVYDAGISVNPEYDTDILRFSYTSLTTPHSIYEYNTLERKKHLIKQQEVVGDFSPDNYEARRLYAKAKDGEDIPVSIVYKKGIERNGKNPLLIYGYGSYGITIDPYFSSVRLSLLDRGFVYAIAHVRGGQIKGRRWYDDGKLLNKMNTFTDFIACTEMLIEEKYTQPSKHFATGGSAGGLLVGTVINMRPELYKGVLASVPFVDVVTTMLDETIPLTTGEYDEWGNPNDEKFYHYILSYSPYDNVKKQDYPNLLVTTGLHDSQVQYWEPAKWVAKLRDMKTDDNLLLMYTNMETGHGGASGRFEKHRETAMEYAFFLDLTGLKE